MIYMGREKRPPSRLARLLERRADALARTEQRTINGSTEKILATGATVSAILLSLTGGLGLLVRSLKNTDLSLSLSLTRATESTEEERERIPEDILPHAPGRVKR